MYCVKSGGERFYVCRDKQEATGTCAAPRIAAEVVEAATLEHLKAFRFDADAWLAERAEAGAADRAELEAVVRELRGGLTKLDRRISGTRRQHEAALDDGDEAVAGAALRELVRYEEERAAVSERVRDAESRVQEWTAEPDVDRARDAVERLQEIIEEADGAVALNAALRRLLAGVYMVRNDSGIFVAYQLADDEPLALEPEDAAPTEWVTSTLDPERKPDPRPA
jgi:exonuclease VII small subunit